jgi:hypothetical protein
MIRFLAMSDPFYLFFPLLAWFVVLVAALAH